MASTKMEDQRLQSFKERLLRLASLAPNKLCAECPESKPTWASILRPPVPGGQRLGVLCCQKCSIFHRQLGERVGTVKDLHMVEEWTEEEIETLERGGGNQIINALYESRLSNARYNKWMVLEDTLEEDTTRTEFIENKYLHLEYFDPVLYKAHLYRMKSQKSSSSTAPRQRRARRCKSFEDPNSTIVQEKGRRDFVRKPLRRRSQSFQEQDRFTTDDESTDDEQRLSYNLPGHLKSMSQSNPEANSSRRRARRSSMPGLSGGTSASAKPTPKSSSTPRKQRRASMKTSSRRDEEDIPSDSELGYGREDDADMDSTHRWSNRRCNSRDGKDTAPTPMANNSSSRWKSGRRKSLPSSTGLGPPPPSSSSCAATCPSNAPKMPTRCISDDSGDDFDLGNETDDTGFMSPPPTKPCMDRIPRRLRRSSMPTASSDEDDLMSKTHNYSPSLPRLTRFETACPMSEPYGMDLGYGFARSTCSGRDEANNNPQNLLKPVKVKPARMPRLGGNGGPAFRRSATNPCRPPPKMLPNDSDSAMSSDEVSYGLPSPAARKPHHHHANHHHHRRKRASRTNRRTMRRCSTGGALDKFCSGRKVPSPESSFEAIPRPNESTAEGLPTLQVQNPSASHTHDALKNLMDLAVAPPCYADLVRSPHHDEFPSMEDLGYGDYGGHESLGTIMSIGTTLSQEDMRYKLDLGYGRFDDRREDEEESDSASAILSRVPRRSSAGAHQRRGSNGGPRRGSNTGAFGPPRARRRSSHKAQDEEQASLPVHFQRQQQRPLHHRRTSAEEPGTRSSILEGGVGTLLRADSLSSICSELSVNVALLCAGESKYSSRGDSLNTASVDQGMKDDSALSSASPVSVSVVSALGYRSVFGEEVDPLACSEKDPADSASESAEQELVEGDKGATPSKKDYWKSKLRETSPPVPSRQDSDAPPCTQRRGQKKSMTTACA